MPMGSTIKPFALSAGVLASALLSLRYSPFLMAAPATVLAVLLFLDTHRERKASGDVDRDSLLFLTALESEHSGPMNLRIKRAASSAPALRNDMLCALLDYEISGNAKVSFSRFKKSNSQRMRVVSELLVAALDGGIDVQPQLSDLLTRQSTIDALRLKSIGGVSNSNLIISAGIIGFFPSFAGISFSILGSISPIGNVESITVKVALLFYIIAANTVFSMHSRLPRPSKLAEAAARSGIGVLAFGIVNAIGISLV